MKKPNFNVFNKIALTSRYYSLLNDWHRELNLKNITRMRYKKISAIYELNDSKLFLIYLFNLYAKWLKANYKFNSDFIRQAWKLAHKLKINNHFSVSQQLVLENIEENIFTAERALKQIDANLPLSPREKCYMFYEKISFSMQTKKLLYKKYTCNIYFTNRNLYVKKIRGSDLLKIPYHKILSMQVLSDCFLLKTSRKEELTFWLANSQVLYYSFQKLRKYKKWPWVITK